jgi:hypothetical protein
MGHPRYSADEIVKRGKEWYERDIRSKVEEGNKGKILMIDIETGEYEIDDNPLARIMHQVPGRRTKCRPAESKMSGLRRTYW